MSVEQPDPAPRRRFARLRGLPWLKIGLATLALLVVIAAVPPLRRGAARVASGVILLVASPLAPSIGELDALPETSEVVASDGSPIARLNGSQDRDPVKLGELPEHVRNAVLAAEDADFYSHSGIDPQGVFRALLRNSTGGRQQGGSTITQQLAKLNYTGGQRTILRKFKEVLYASKLEKRYSKDELLERYLNQVYFGDGAYGIAAAAQRSFGVEAKNLSAAQAAELAARIRAPERLDPENAAAAVKERRDQVLREMVDNEWLDPAGRDAAIAAPVDISKRRPEAADDAVAPHFLEFVKREAATLEVLGPSPEARVRALYTRGFRIETTLDRRMYDAATVAVREQLGAPGDPATAVVSVAPGDGALRVLFGGLGFDRKFDVASQGQRQPGSAFKPFVYLAALAAGIDPRTTYPSESPRTFNHGGETFEVENYEGEGGGLKPVDEAMTHSINTVFMQLGLDAKPENVVRAARSAGIVKPGTPAAPRNEDLEPFPSVSLGGLSKGVSPLEMAAAYATFAAKGVYAEPYAITAIRDGEGRVLYSRRPKVRAAFDSRQVGVLTQALTGVIAGGTGRGADIGRPVAGKTGTTQNYGDAWFVGYVPQLATAVWVGNPDARVPMTNVHGRRVAGGTFPASIFARMMRESLQGVPVQPLFIARPEDLGLAPPTTATTVTTLPPPSSTTSTDLSTTTTQRPTTTTTEPEPTTTTVREEPSTTTTSTPADDGRRQSSGETPSG